MAEWLAARGHEVEMVTTFPYYPSWRKRPEDKGRLYGTDVLNGVTVRRCWHYVPARVTALRRMVHEASFLATSWVRMATLRRADVIVAVSPPLPLGIPVWLISRLWRRPFVFHVQDLQPDAAVGLGMLRPGRFTKLLYALEAFAYRKAAAVSGISDGMLDAFRRKGVEAQRRWFFPNWVADTMPGQAEVRAREAARAAFCSRHGIDPRLPLLVYSGNVGMKQGLGVLLEAALVPVAGDAQPCWIVAGDGAGKEALLALAAQRGAKSVRFLPLQPDAAFVEMLIAADVAVITQQKGTGQFFFPSKLLTALGRGKPVLAVADADSELARAVVEGGFGLVAPPDDPAAVAKAAATMACASASQHQQWSQSGLSWVSRFSRSVVLAEFEAQLAKLASRKS
jgi:colanic acid biosynthesis glycosyl transferase WcaI